MINTATNTGYSLLLIICSAGIGITFQIIRSKLKKIDEAYEKLKIECDNKVTKSDLKELLELYVRPLVHDISNIKETLKQVVKIKANTNGN